MPYSNKEKQQEYYEKNREKIKAKQRAYNKREKENIAIRKKEKYEEKKKENDFYEKKNEKAKTRYAKWKENLTEEQEIRYIKRKLKTNWKRQGFKHTKEFFEELSIRYIETKNCEICNVELLNKVTRHQSQINNKKVSDHHHSSGSFRNICCQKCNNQRSKIDNNHLRVMMELHRYFMMR